jgi:uncharacterized alpha-E superfamily protein
MERAEATLRLVRALINRAAEADDSVTSVNEQIGLLLRAWNAAPSDILDPRPALLAASVLQHSELPGTLPTLARCAQGAASVIRDRFPPDAWRALTEMVESINRPFEQIPEEGAMFERVNGALRIIASFSGLAQENMSQLHGWRFLELGHRLERALATCRFIRGFAFGGALDAALDCLLELADSQITYRLRYVMVAAPTPVIDLVALDPNNPRSILYQLARIETHLAALSRHRDTSRLSPVEQVAIALATRMRTADPEVLGDAMLIKIEEELMRLSDTVASFYFTSRERSDASQVLN